jgi:hypothetical protein
MYIIKVGNLPLFLHRDNYLFTTDIGLARRFDTERSANDFILTSKHSFVFSDNFKRLDLKCDFILYYVGSEE